MYSCIYVNIVNLLMNKLSCLLCMYWDFIADIESFNYKKYPKHEKKEIQCKKK